MSSPISSIEDKKQLSWKELIISLYSMNLIHIFYLIKELFWITFQFWKLFFLFIHSKDSKYTYSYDNISSQDIPIPHIPLKDPLWKTNMMELDLTQEEHQKWSKIQIYSLSLILKLYKKTHYRCNSFQQDMINNLQNVAIPGTCIPLSLFASNYYLTLFFILVFNPLICFISSISFVIINNKQYYVHKPLDELVVLVFDQIITCYTYYLLHPNDWFSLWRLNCRLISYHSLITQSIDYQQEDKWTFLTNGKSLDVPISPYMDVISSLVCKNKNIEGGMGIFFYRNAAHGGDWVSSFSY